jgi:hypothetical protein
LSRWQWSFENLRTHGGEGQLPTPQPLTRIVCLVLVTLAMAASHPARASHEPASPKPLPRSHGGIVGRRRRRPCCDLKTLDLESRLASLHFFSSRRRTSSKWMTAPRGPLHHNLFVVVGTTIVAVLPVASSHNLPFHWRHMDWKMLTKMNRKWMTTRRGSR